MNVTVRPAKGSIEFVKKGTGNNGATILNNTEFTLSGGDFTQKQITGQNGYIRFDNIPLGRDYELTETDQPNKYYRKMYHTTINNFNGDLPTQSYNLGEVVNGRTHQQFQLVKKDMQGNALKGAQFVLVRNDNGNAHISIDEAKKQAYRREGDELVEGRQDQDPYIATSNEKGEVVFDMVQIPNDDREHTYYAVEIKAPDKYTLSQTSVKLTAGKYSPDVVGGELSDTTNTLPATGSDKLLIIVGSVVALGVLGTGTYWIKNRKAK